MTPPPPTATPAAPPALTTARLTLRGHRLDDFTACAAMWADPLVVRHITGHPFTEEEVWARLLRYAGHWSLLGFGYWAVFESASGRFMGEVGFADFRRTIVPTMDGAPEAGWVLASWAHGRGFAGEAVGAALAWATGRFGAQRTVCMIDPTNKPSLRLAGRHGYREYARTLYKGHAAVLLERPGAV